MSITYRFSTRSASFTLPFKDDREALDYAHGVTDDDSCVVERLAGCVWQKWDSSRECFVFPPDAVKWGTLVLAVDIPGSYPVRLFRKGKRFNVVYGADAQTDLADAEAAKEFGFSVFHALRCGGAL